MATLRARQLQRSARRSRRSELANRDTADRWRRSVCDTSGDPSPSTQPATLRLPQKCNGFFFPSFVLIFFVNFCLMILVPLGIFFV